MKKALSCIAVLLLLALTLAAGGCGNPGPEKTVQAFLEEVDQGNVSQAMDLLDPGFRRQAGEDKTRMMVTMMVDSMKEQGGVKSVKVVKEDVQGERATLRVRVETNKGEPEEDDVKLVKIDGKWYMAMDMMPDMDMPMGPGGM